MSAVDFFAASGVLIVAGKGGVGKTTVGATLGLAAARAGVDVLLVELEGHSSLGAPFGVDELRYETAALATVAGKGRLRGRQVSPDRALREYLQLSGFDLLGNRLARTGALEVVATAAPGIRDLLALGKIRQLEQRGDAELIIVDAPAAGHAVSFLQAPAGLARSAPSGPVRHQADLVLDLLGDEGRCRTILVTTPEETPVTEAVETAFSLRERVGVHLGPVVVNGRWPAIDGLQAAVDRRGSKGRAERAARYRLDRMAEQEAEIERLRARLPMAVLELPFLFTIDIERSDLDRLADHLTAEIEAGS